jgi:hypothetical protein
MPSSANARKFTDEPERMVRKTAVERQRASQMEALAGLRRLRRDRALEDTAGARLGLDKAEQYREATGQRLQDANRHLGHTHALVDAMVRTGGADLRQIHRGTDATRYARFDVERHERQLDRCHAIVDRAGLELQQREEAARASALAYERIFECKKWL